MINLLDSLTIDKIAAGEVIDRPASVVKELMENAIDAGSTSISVSISNGGKSRIIVTDNGKGINHKELPIAVKRHATSKISSFEDLNDVRSLGFRGEALASIASVARLEIISKEEEMDAWRYVIEGGKQTAYEECAGTNGTRIVVSDLFFNVPVRLKFLKSHVTESNHIGRIVQMIALSHPEIAFELIVDGREKLRTSASNDLSRLIYEVFGHELYKEGELFDVTLDAGSDTPKNTAPTRAYGFIGSPGIGRGNHNYEITFVNNRHVENKMLNHAIEDGYSGFLMDHKFPFMLLYLEIDPKSIDVNVHPTKNDIKFSSPETVHKFIKEIVAERLKNKNMVHTLSPDNISNTKKRLDTYNYFYDKKDALNGAESDADPLSEDSLIEQMRERIRKRYEEQNKENLKPGESAAVNSNISEEVKTDISEVAKSDISEGVKTDISETAKPDISEAVKPIEDVLKDDKASQIFLDIPSQELFDSSVKIIGQVFDTYWIAELNGELIIIDQHAAHEKVLYEKYLNEISSKRLMTQIVDPPVMINIPIEEQSFVKAYADTFKDFGFEIESIGERDYLLRGIPYELSELGTKEGFQEFVDELFEGSAITPSPRKLKEKIAMCACKAAVKGNSRLSKVEIEHLLGQMMKLDNPYNCPHGRPTMIRMTKRDIEKHFGRIQ